MAALSWRELDTRGGAMVPVNGRFPVRADVDPFELVRVIQGADCCEKVLGSWEGPSV